MSNPTQENVATVEDGSNAIVRSCQVCYTTVGVGNHYGAITCDNCRLFFKYHISKIPGTIATKACSNLNSCQLTPSSRKCQECRMAVCLKIGMTYQPKVVHQAEPVVVIAEETTIKSRHEILGPKTLSKLRGAFLGTEAISIEEHRVLMMESERVNCVETNDLEGNDSGSEDKRLSDMAQKLRLEVYAQYADSVYLANEEGHDFKGGRKESKEDEDYLEQQTRTTHSSNMIGVDFNESIITGSNMRQAISKPVTSTPANSFMAVSDFFGNFTNIESKPSNNKRFLRTDGWGGVDGGNGSRVQNEYKYTLWF